MSTPVPAPTHPVTALRTLVGAFPSALLGYSGGVGSAFLGAALPQELGGEHRPGYAAGRRAGVRSPLAEVGMTKAQIREVSHGLGLPTWDAPAAPCLSSRVVYGLTITPERLRQVEAAERYLRELGVTGDLRVRHHGGGGARIEVEPPWIPWLEQRLDCVTVRLVALGFGTVEVDPRGYRRGSLLERTSRA